MIRQAVTLTLFLVPMLTLADETNPSPAKQFFSAVESGDTQTIVRFIEQGIDVNLPDNEGSTPLHHAAKMGQVLSMTTLLDRGARVDVFNQDRYTALGVAIIQGQAKVAAILISKKANTVLMQGKGMTEPLFHLAAISGDPDTIRLVLSLNPNIKQLDESHCNALNRLCNRWGNKPDPKNIEAVKLLIEAGINPHEKNGGEYIPLVASSSVGNIYLVKGLLQYSKPTQEELDSAVYIGSYFGSEDVVTLLLENGGTADRKDGTNDTPIRTAVRLSSVNIIRKLLKHGARIEARSGPENRTPLLDAVACSTVDVVKLLLENHADIAAKDSAGNDAFAILKTRIELGRAKLSRKKGERMPEWQTEPDHPAKIQSLLHVYSKQKP